MRILFASAPGTGHLRSLLPLLAACRAHGHEAALAVSPDLPRGALPDQVPVFAKRPAGFPASPYGSGPRRADWWTETVREMARQSLADCLEILDGYAPDLLVRDSSERGACLAAQLRGIPQAVVFPGATAGLEYRRAEDAGLLAPLRAGLGLAPDPEGRTLTRTGLSLMHPGFHGPRASLAAATVFCRRTDLGHMRRPAGTRRRLLATLGTTGVVDHAGFMRALLSERAADVEITAVVPDAYRDRLRTEFPEVDVRGFTRLEPLLDRTDLLVTHGGFNTVGEALGRGIPMHVNPRNADQRYVADRCVALGCGVRGRESGHDDAKALAGEVLRALHDPGLRAAAERMGALIRGMPPVDAYVSVLEDLAGV